MHVVIWGADALGVAFEQAGMNQRGDVVGRVLPDMAQQRQALGRQCRDHGFQIEKGQVRFIDGCALFKLVDFPGFRLAPE